EQKTCTTRDPAASRDPSLPAIQHRQRMVPICRYFKPSDGLEPSTPSLPWKFWGGNAVHARALATVFVLQICASRCDRRARACPGVHELVYPSRTREALPLRKTDNGALAACRARPRAADRKVLLDRGQ